MFSIYIYILKLEILLTSASISLCNDYNMISVPFVEKDRFANLITLHILSCTNQTVLMEVDEIRDWNE